MNIFIYFSCSSGSQETVANYGFVFCSIKSKEETIIWNHRQPKAPIEDVVPFLGDGTQYSVSF